MKDKYGKKKRDSGLDYDEIMQIYKQGSDFFNKQTIRCAPSLPDGEPCDHPGCLSHVSHPCEGCGRVGGKR